MCGEDGSSWRKFPGTNRPLGSSYVGVAPLRLATSALENGVYAMKAKWISMMVGVALLIGSTWWSHAADPVPVVDGPAEQAPAPQVFQMQTANGPNARGEGQLVKLPVPEAAAFKTEEGRTGWKVTIPGGRPLTTPAVVDGVLYVGGGFGSYEFYALDAKTGKPRWTFKCGDDGPTAAVVADGCVAYNTESCTIYIQDSTNGKVLWHRWLGDPLMSQPAIGGGKVLMAYPGKGGHRLAAFALRTGKVAWDKPIAAEIISAPVMAGDFVVAATVDGTLYKFNLASGEVVWQKKHQVTSAPRVLGRQIFISQRTEKEIKLKDGDGKETSSTVTLEGLNLVSLDDGTLTHEKPLAAVKASFLLALGAQQQLYAGNAAVHFSGQGAYRMDLNAGSVLLNDVSGALGGQAKSLTERIDKFAVREPSPESTAGEKDATEALQLARDIEKLANALPDDGTNNNAGEQLKTIARDVLQTAEKTKDAAEAAAQAEQTMAATKVQQAEDQQHDASVGFSSAPEAAKLSMAAGNIGQSNVKAVWAYQGSRPCLHKGTSIMIHGPKMQAVDVKTGKVVWEHAFDFEAEATRPVTPPALAGGKLYVGTVDGRILCLDADSGKTLWQATIGGRILFEPSVAAGAVYAATADGTLICLNTSDPTADGWHMWGGSAKHNGQE